jgi:hypothetical protein
VTVRDDRGQRDLNCPFAADQPVRSLAAYAATGQTLSPETMLRVQDGRVIFANYGAILADFSWILQPLLADSRDPASMIDSWLVGNTAYVSTSQTTAKGTVSTPVPLDGATCTAWRPPRYGRAAVMADRSGADPAQCALFDVKGIGVPPDEQPCLPNSNGLLTLEEAVHEVLMEHLVFAVMGRTEVDVRPLPSYAVLDLGFDATWQDGRPPGRATALLRRAATRPRCQWQRADQGAAMAQTLLRLELLLRTGGLSASVCGAVRLRLTDDGAHRRIFRDDFELAVPENRKAAVFDTLGWAGHDMLVDGVNVQVTSGCMGEPLRARLMDFGRYRFEARFDAPLYAWFDADYLSMNGAYLRPNDPLYVQPHPTAGLAQFEGSDPHRALIAAVGAYQDGQMDGAGLAGALRHAITAAGACLNRAPFRATHASVETATPNASSTGTLECLGCLTSAREPGMVVCL